MTTLDAHMPDSDVINMPRSKATNPQTDALAVASAASSAYMRASSIVWSISACA